jgi:predicted DNA-binding transcriptional regulator AlpA
MSVNEVVQRTGHTRQWVHQRIRDGTLKYERKGRRIDVDGHSVQAWMWAEMTRLVTRVEHLYLNMPHANDSD